MGLTLTDHQTFETLLVDIGDDGIATVTLNRPEKLNALNRTVRQEIMRAVDALAEDDRVRVVILTGAGEKAFVAGADVSEFHARTPEEQREVYKERRCYDAIGDFPKPILCAIHGFCLGGGNELALACDLRIADETARFGQFEIRLGLIPGAGGTQRLARLVGPGQALRIGLSGDFVEAEEAYRIGMVEFLTPPGEHVAKARELAGRMARWSPVALRLVKQAVRQASETPLSEGLLLEKELFLQAFASEDGQEGVQAFVEKRRPDFKGH
ncbi:MAG: crotonase [Gemmatimonadetes bacterium]|nr:crotonase [Gemmatimonadota bacterium]